MTRTDKLLLELHLNGNILVYYFESIANFNIYVDNISSIYQCLEKNPWWQHIWFIIPILRWRLILIDWKKSNYYFCSWKLLSLSLECTWSYKNMELSHKSYFCIRYFYLYSLFLCNNIYEWRYKACRKRLMFSFLLHEKAQS